MEGFGAQTLTNGVRHVVIHYSADPSKNQEWVKKERQGMSSQGLGQRNWDREMELREDVYDGEPVYADYRDSWHCPERYREEGIPLVRGSAYVGGWDAGATLQPAFVLYQITQSPYQVHAIWEVTSEGGDPMQLFGQRVLHDLQRNFPGIWGMIVHVGDTTITQRSGTTGDTAKGVAKKLGLEIKPVSNIWDVRYSAMSWLLTDQIEAKTDEGIQPAPRFMVCAKNCPTFREALKGAYRFEESPKGTSSGAGRILTVPLKNSYSHIADAGQYAAQEAKKIITERSPGIRKW